METSQLKCFMAVAETGSFTKAAEKLFRTQPVVSRQIQSLENELGFEVLLRDSKSCELTEAGKYLYAQLKSISASFATALKTAEKISSGLSGSLTIGMTAGENSAILSELTYGASRSLQGINIDFIGINIKDIRELLENKSCDIIFTVYSNPWFNSINSPSFRHIRVGERKDYLFISKRHALAGRDPSQLTLHDFENDTFLFLSPFEVNSETGPTISLLRSLGVEPRYREVPTIDSLILALQNNQGVLIGSNRMWCYGNDEFVSIRLPEFGSLPEIMMWNTANTNPCISRFVEAVEKQLK